MTRDIDDEQAGRAGDNRCQRADRIAQLGRARFLAVSVEMDKAALLVDVRERMD
jgi:hypothetical protein